MLGQQEASDTAISIYKWVNAQELVMKLCDRVELFCLRIFRKFLKGVSPFRQQHLN